MARLSCSVTVTMRPASDYKKFSEGGVQGRRCLFKGISSLPKRGYMKHVDIYTDGACKPNPGPGGWGAIIVYKQTEKEACGLRGADY